MRTTAANNGNKGVTTLRQRQSQVEGAAQSCFSFDFAMTIDTVLEGWRGGGMKGSPLKAHLNPAYCFCRLAQFILLLFGKQLS